MAGKYLVSYVYFDEKKHEARTYPESYCPIGTYESIKEAKQAIKDYMSENKDVLFFYFTIKKWEVIEIDGRLYKGYFNRVYSKNIRKMEDIIGKEYWLWKVDYIVC